MMKLSFEHTHFFRGRGLLVVVLVFACLSLVFAGQAQALSVDLTQSNMAATSASALYINEELERWCVPATVQCPAGFDFYGSPLAPPMRLYGTVDPAGRDVEWWFKVTNRDNPSVSFSTEIVPRSASAGAGQVVAEVKNMMPGKYRFSLEGRVAGTSFFKVSNDWYFGFADLRTSPAPKGYVPAPPASPADVGSRGVGRGSPVPDAPHQSSEGGEVVSAPGKPVVALVDRKLVLKNGRIKIELRCMSDSKGCEGQAKLQTLVKSKSAKQSRRTGKRKAKPVDLTTRSSFRIEAGESRTLQLKAVKRLGKKTNAELVLATDGASAPSPVLIAPKR